MKTTIYMVRHAESPYAFGQEKTRGLSEEGFEAARKIANLLTDVSIDHIVSSSYTRAIQTVQCLADGKGLPIVSYEELRERPIKGLGYEAPWEELMKAIEQSFIDHDYALEGGETTKEAQLRAIPVIEHLLREYKGKNVVVGTHGGIMTIIMNYYDRSYGYEFWNQTSKPDIYKMTFDQNRLECVDRLWEVEA